MGCAERSYESRHKSGDSVLGGTDYEHEQEHEAKCEDYWLGLD